MLVTSIVRRVFTADGQIKPDSLVPYVEAVRAVAAEKQRSADGPLRAHANKAEQAGSRGLPRYPCGRLRTASPIPRISARSGGNRSGVIAAQEFVRAVPAMRPRTARRSGRRCRWWSRRRHRRLQNDPDGNRSRAFRGRRPAAHHRNSPRHVQRAASLFRRIVPAPRFSGRTPRPPSSPRP